MKTLSRKFNPDFQHLFTSQSNGCTLIQVQLKSNCYGFITRYTASQAEKLCKEINSGISFSILESIHNWEVLSYDTSKNSSNVLLRAARAT